MNNYFRTASGFIMAGCFAGAVFAQTVSMELTGTPTSDMGGVYTGPYTALIGPSNTDPAKTGTSTLVICDDFLTEVSSATPPWQATVTNMSALANLNTASTAVKFDRNSSTTQQQQDYMTAAYLVEQLVAVNQSTVQGQTLAGELSFAIWDVFDPNATLDPLLSSAQRNSAVSYLVAAKLAVSNGSPLNFANLDIYTPSPNMNASQEYFVVRTPEPPSLAILAFDLSGFACLLFAFRRKLFPKNARI